MGMGVARNTFAGFWMDFEMRKLSIMRARGETV
jgi:hypothetical protein